MSYDEFILNALIKGLITKPVLRIYGWIEETISLGQNQKIDNNEFKSYGNLFPVVKRITGGQAVFHKLSNDELTYSVSLSYEKSAKYLYSEIGNVLCFFLQELGLNPVFGDSNNYLADFNCFNSNTKADILVNNKKIIGSAQRRKKKFILQHGAIRLDIIRSLSLKPLNSSHATWLLKKSFENVMQIDFQDYNIENILNPLLLVS